jgi:hypothetical protein
MRISWAVLVIALGGQAAGCAYSSYQSAKIMPQGGTSVTGAVTQYGYHGDMSQNETAFELMGSHAVTDAFELGGKFSFFSDEGVRSYNLLVAPKVGIIPAQLAFTAPTGMVLFTSEEDIGDDTENLWMTQPGLVFSVPFNPFVELDLAGKWVMMFSDDLSENNGAVAANAGVRFTLPNTTMSVMPEVGVLWDNDEYDTNETEYFLQIGFAFSYEFLPPGAMMPAAAPAAGPPGAAPAQ